MGMRIGNGNSNAWGNYQTASSVGSEQQKQQTRKTLFSAIESGDLTAAQTAYTALQNQGIGANSPLNAIGQSLQSGDITGAQKAVQSMQAARAGHGHHMHFKLHRDIINLSQRITSGSRCCICCVHAKPGVGIRAARPQLCHQFVIFHHIGHQPDCISQLNRPLPQHSSCFVEQRGGVQHIGV
jgi:hypothetical protein